jgi:hypothetical protein
MRRLFVAAALVLVSAPAFADRDRNFSIEDRDSCTGRNVRFNHRAAHVVEETIDAGNLRSLSVKTENSPLTVTGGNTRGYTIVVCKAAEFAEDLDDIRVTVEGGELRATGPSNDNDWTVLFRVHVPAGGEVHIDAKNGPVAVRDIDATVVARLSNGPLALSDASGNIDVETRNGPISIHGGSGTMKVKASNGPLSVNLDGASFNGTLDASTRNGPLSVTVPANYGSGVTVESKGRGPISCRAAGCAEFRRAQLDDDDDYYDDRPRVIELGSGPTNVRLSTVNGPVTIRED